MPRAWTRALFPACTALVALTRAAPTAAAIPLCLELDADAGDAAGFPQLVRSEVERHPSHVLVDSACEARLHVELFRVGGSRYLTLRLDGSVPLRFHVRGAAELESRLSEGVSRVLGNDPAYVAEDPATRSALGRSLLVRGHNQYRLAFFEAVARTDRTPAFAPGIAFEVLRGADHFAVFARLALAASPGGVSAGGRALRLLGQADAGLVYEASARAASTVYAGVGAGVAFLRFEGPAGAASASESERVSRLGATLEARFGARFLRLHDFDCDAFLLGALPLFVTRDPEASLFGPSGTYTPFLELGLGVGF